MKFKKLTIKNIASIAEATLDFESEALRDASLFLICGETGAGKTTILDAVTLALYGRTARYADRRSRNDVAVGGLAFNDPRQLVRRGAASASATLTLLGNDNRVYEANWSVETVSRGKNRGQLKGEKWTWKDLSPAGITSEKVSECMGVVRRAVGLEFEQFCRTSLLAQGQFTKFLLGTEDEKAEILEKLTDTSRYKGIGQRIAERYGALEAAVKQCEANLNALAGLGEKRAEVEAGIAEVKGLIAETEARTETMEKCRDWLKQERERSERVQHVRAVLTHDVSALKRVASKRAQAHEAAVRRLAEARSALEAQTDRAPMLEAADVILAELDDARESLRREAQGRKELAALQQRLPSLRTLLETARQNLSEAVQKAESKGGELDLAEHRLEALGLVRLRKQQESIQKRQGDLKWLKATLDAVGERNGALAKQEASLAGRMAELEQGMAALPGLERSAQAARSAAEKTRADRDRQKALIDDGIEKIVAELKAGETCPICGNRIAHLNGEAHFAKLVAVLNDSCRTAEIEAERQAEKANALKATINASEKAIADLKEQISTARNEIARASAAVADGAKALGLSSGTVKVIEEERAASQTAFALVAEKLAEGGRQEVQIAQLRAEGKKLGKAVDKAKDAVSKAELALQKSESDISAKQTAVKTEGERAAQKIAAAGGKIVLSDWETAWNSDPVAFEGRLDAEGKAYRALKESIPSRESSAADLAKECRQVAECVARAVAAWPALAGVAAADEDAAVVIADVDGRVGALRSMMEAGKRLAAEKPEVLKDTDTEESLLVAMDEDKDAVGRLQEEKGRLEQQIEADDKCAAERLAKEAELKALRVELDEWAVLHEYFGDKDGKKIRREIQTYVLANVLAKANHYLTQLTDRYELSCEGLTLTVNDAFEGGVTRPVDTLSGGESFLVSLALALGLAGMNEQGLSVDMLFIDEGFGTLSGDHLSAALEALERLNEICGSRKVGVISHVERLRERIRTHVEVSRNGHDPATVRVIMR